MNVDDLLSELVGFGENDLRRVRDAVISLLGSDGCLQDDISHAWKIVRHVCPGMPHWVIVRHQASFMSKASALAALLERAKELCPSQRGEDIDFIAMALVRCAVTWLHDVRDKSLTPIWMLIALENLGTAVDSQFPGYAESKLLGSLFLRQRKRQRK